MATKSIVTRIKNKIDTLDKWQSYTGTLLDGEIAVVRVPTGSTYTNPVTGADEPVVELLMKVGDGNTSFANLPWMSAKASDVYDWAKAAAVVFNEDNYHLEFRAADNTIIAHADLTDIDARLDALEAIKITVTPNDSSKPGVVQSVTQGDASHEIDVTYGLIKTADIDAKQVTAEKIADSTITATQLADGAVSTVSIAAGAVTDAKIASGVSSDKITVKNTSDTLTTKLADIEAAISGLDETLTKGIIFRGEVTSAPVGSTYTLKGTETAVPAHVGDMVICGEKEYVYLATNDWKELGDLGRVTTLETWRTKLQKDDTAVASQFVTEVDIAADGTVTINRAQPTASDISYGDSSDVDTKLGAIDAALANKAVKDHEHGHITKDGELDTANRVAITDTDKKLTVSSITADELNALAGISTAETIQSQLNKKGTSNLTIGTTDTTAAAGNHNHDSAYAAKPDFVNVEANYVRFAADASDNTKGKLYVGKDGTDVIIFDCGGAEDL